MGDVRQLRGGGLGYGLAGRGGGLLLRSGPPVPAIFRRGPVGSRAVAVLSPFGRGPARAGPDRAHAVHPGLAAKC
ncbi:hypothetical protein D3M50_19490 [Klebsiella pneumoniae]|nr:hypothetical protein [Klebsiella pneumoniae]